MMVVQRVFRVILGGVLGFALLQVTPSGLLSLAHAITPEAPAPKVTICHFPPGNPANYRTIRVSEHAVKAHVRHHGDLIGDCATVCDDNNACTNDSLPTPGGCVHTPIAGCCNTNTDCDDGVACTLDACDPATHKCTVELVNAACDDGSLCTSDLCTTTGCVNADLCTPQQVCNDLIGCLDLACNDPDGCCPDRAAEAQRDRCLDTCTIRPYTEQCLNECNCLNGCTPPAPVTCNQ